MPDFGRILYELRKRNHMTQLELARRLGIAKSTISMYEHGNRMPDYETMEAIAACFGVDMNYLYGMQSSSSQDRFLTFYAEMKPFLDPKDLEDLCTLMRLRAELHKPDKN